MLNRQRSMWLAYSKECEVGKHEVKRRSRRLGLGHIRSCGKDLSFYSECDGNLCEVLILLWTTAQPQGVEAGSSLGDC